MNQTMFIFLCHQTKFNKTRKDMEIKSQPKKVSIKRIYQERDLTDIIKQIDGSKNVMYQLPTGGGKSVVAADFVHNYHNKEILILAHRRELILQMEERLSSDKISPSVFVGDIQKDINSNITIGSVQTLSRDKRLETTVNKKFDIVIVDEAHHLRTPSYDKILNHLKEINPDIRILGLTATPWRSDKKDFREFIDVLITSETVDSLISQGYLSKFRTFVTSIGDIDKEVEKNENDYNITSLSKYMRQDIFLQHLVDQYRERGEDRQTLIFAVDKLHLQAIKQKFIDNGYDSIEDITAETPQGKREQSLNNFKSGKLRFIVSIGTLTEGTDLPDANCLIIARPTESLVMFHQILGRGMRVSSNGEDLVILDCAGVTKKHGSVNSPRVWSLDPTNDPKQKTKRSKIVGKRADGSYTDDVEEIEGGDIEVVEMSPEEYITHSSNAIEEANKYNLEIDNDISRTYLTFREELKKIVEEIDPTIKAELSTGKYDYDSLTVKIPTLGEYYSVDFEKMGEYLIPKPNRPWSSRQEDPLSVLKLNKLVGDLSIKMMKEKFGLKHKEMRLEVETLEDSKIDVRGIEKAKKEFERDQFIQKLEAHLTINNVIKLPKEIRLMHVFPPQGYERVNTLVFSKNKLLSTNEIIWCNGDREEYISKWFEKQKLIDFLIERKWGTEVPETVEN